MEMSCSACRSIVADYRSRACANVNPISRLIVFCNIDLHWCIVEYISMFCMLFRYDMTPYKGIRQFG